MKAPGIFLLMILSGTAGAIGATAGLHSKLVEAQSNEAQANGLEDQCKAVLTNTNQTMAAAFGATNGSTGVKFTPLRNGGWKYEHIPIPACKDGLKRTVDIPERDEVDALTVNCGVE